MLKIISDKIIVHSNALNCIDYLSDLNNYKNLLPDNKINKWESSADHCKFNIQNTYPLEIKKKDISKNNVFLVSGKESPFSFKIKVEIQEKDSENCIAQITCEADVNPILKVLVGKPLNELFNYMANNIEKAILLD